ncbi:voltage-dependent p/q type calcium channel [Anopheles sinensis]|uniref:Voltage-dependent p/q type calcium channel n=1 Tax=Anopheles sinensis TaxID=74873 RepID=A0A084VQN4_ANOSI|nr:voltage-dependent p/q type calcium channel [Anopheles sinensis]
MFVVLRFMSLALRLYAATTISDEKVIVQALAGLGYHVYLVLVAVQLSESMLNVSMSIFVTNFEHLEERKAPEEQKAEMKSEKK